MMDAVHANDSETTTIVNARIWTGDPARPHASSIAFRGGRIVALDAPASGHVVDLGDRWLGPAFIDAHLHLTLGAATLAQCDLSACASREEFEARVAAHAKALDASDERGAWLVGFGWNEADWRGDAPTRAWLSAAGPRPAVAWRMGPPACVVYDAALA
ncbi:MAG: amidohydrolase family protein, partial [Phycisphaerales bacterium]